MHGTGHLAMQVSLLAAAPAGPKGGWLICKSNQFCVQGRLLSPLLPHTGKCICHRPQQQQQPQQRRPTLKPPQRGGAEPMVKSFLLKSGSRLGSPVRRLVVPSTMSSTNLYCSTVAVQASRESAVRHCYPLPHPPPVTYLPTYIGMRRPDLLNELLTIGCRLLPIALLLLLGSADPKP